MAAVKMKYEIVGQCGRAKSAHMETVHGVIETPVFMNVGGGGRVVVSVSAKGSPFGFSITSRGCSAGGKRVFLALDSLASDDDEVTV